MIQNLQVTVNKPIKMSWINTTYINYPEKKLSLGHQKLASDQVEAVVERLNVVKKCEKPSKVPEPSVTLTKDEIADMVERLADKEKNVEKTPERDRTGACKQMGIVNTYAWNNGKIIRNNIHTPDGNFY